MTILDHQLKSSLPLELDRQLQRAIDDHQTAVILADEADQAAQRAFERIKESRRKVMELRRRIMEAWPKSR